MSVRIPEWLRTVDRIADRTEVTAECSAVQNAGARAPQGMSAAQPGGAPTIVAVTADHATIAIGRIGRASPGADRVVRLVRPGATRGRVMVGQGRLVGGAVPKG